MQPSPFKSPLPMKSPAARQQQTPSQQTPLKVGGFCLTTRADRPGQAARSSIPGAGALETEEQWFVLFEALRTGRRHAKRSLRLGDGALLESFVSAMASEGKSEMLKCGLLVCLQENSVLFLEHDTKVGHGPRSHCLSCLTP
jgi:hypothetical protein